MKRIELTPNLVAYESRAAGGTVNGILTTSDGGVILIDPGILPEELAEIREEIGDCPVHLIVQTHAHWDHVFGLTTWPDVPRVAGAGYPRVKTQAAQMLEAVLRGIEEQVGTLDPRPALLEPTRLVESREPLHELAPGWDVIPAPGHSIDMLALYDASNRLLWSTDILSDREPPMMIPGTTAEYLATLDTLSALDIDILVACHGSIATTPGAVADRFKAEYDYVIELRERVQQAVDAGKSPEEAVAACADMRFVNAEMYTAIHADNVHITYGELVGLSGYEDESDENDPERTGLPVDGDF